MTMKSVSAIGAVLLLAAGASGAFAQQSSTPAAAAPSNLQAKASSSSKSRDPNEMVCKRSDTTGSRLGANKQCHTRAEWDQMDRYTQDTVRGAEAGAYLGGPRM